jgi:F-type H+-transporting ATPase subunit b
MPKREVDIITVCLCLGIIVGNIFFCTDAFAEGGTGSGRKIWDNIMLWVNFGILVVLFLKYAKKPLMDLLRGARSEIKDELDEINSKRDNAKTLAEAESKKLEEIDEGIAALREGILEMGRREKERIIEQAKIAAEKMVRDAKAYSEYRLTLAKKALAVELTDIAVSLVEKKLTKGFTMEDNDKLIEKFVTDLASSKGRF